MVSNFKHPWFLAAVGITCTVASAFVGPDHTWLLLFPAGLFLAGWICTTDDLFSTWTSTNRRLGKTVLAVIAILLLGVLGLWYKEQRPHVNCALDEGESLCEIRCSVLNPTFRPVREVTIGFQGLLPFKTQLASKPESRMVLKKPETLPLPDSSGKISEAIRAFTIEVPLVPPRTRLEFILRTASDANQKACVHLASEVRSLQRQIMTDKYTLVSGTNSAAANMRRLDTVLS